MEEQLVMINDPLAAAHLLQRTLRSFCTTGDSPWLYAVFWRILPRNHPPPTWDLEGRAHGTDTTNRRNWILAWEDGFCNFCSRQEMGMLEEAGMMQPQVFFRMSHEIHSCAHGLIGKVAVAESHKWVFKDHLHNVLPKSTINPDDCQPRSWEAQFQSGIKTIALIAVKHGVLQLGSVNKVMEDLSCVGGVRHKFDYLGDIPGFLLPYLPPSSRHQHASFNPNAQELYNENRATAAEPPSVVPSIVQDSGRLSEEEVAAAAEVMKLWTVID